jgi:hypothetical protein
MASPQSRDTEKGKKMETKKKVRLTDYFNGRPRSPVFFFFLFAFRTIQVGKTRSTAEGTVPLLLAFGSSFFFFFAPAWHPGEARLSRR